MGGGRATIGLSCVDLLGPTAPVALGGAPIRFGQQGGPGTGHRFDPPDLTTRAWRISENFLNAEPQANVLVTLNRWMRIDAGVGIV